MPTNKPKPRPDLAHVFTAMRLRTAVAALEHEVTPTAAANTLLAYHEHAKAIGVRL